MWCKTLAPETLAGCLNDSVRYYDSSSPDVFFNDRGIVYQVLDGVKYRAALFSATLFLQNSDPDQTISRGIVWQDDLYGIGVPPPTVQSRVTSLPYSLTEPGYYNLNAKRRNAVKSIRHAECVELTGIEKQIALAKISERCQSIRAANETVGNKNRSPRYLYLADAGLYEPIVLEVCIGENTSLTLAVANGDCLCALADYRISGHIEAKPTTKANIDWAFANGFQYFDMENIIYCKEFEYKRVFFSREVRTSLFYSGDAYPDGIIDS